MTPLLEPTNETNLIIGHPGTGLSDILPSLVERLTSREDTQVRWMFWDVTPMNLTQSATCFVRAIGETIERGTFLDANAHQKAKFSSLSKQLESLAPLFENTHFVSHWTDYNMHMRPTDLKSTPLSMYATG